jgi:4-amino-4-deoxy-L-arabinose transferase-like glycosyltransferase
MSDEGAWARNARQRAVFGSWVIDEHNPLLDVSPLHTLAVFGAYQSFGVSFFSTRLPSALAGIATCALLYLFLSREVSGAAALLALFLHGASFFVLAHDRVGFGESFQNLWITAALLLLCRARGSRLAAVGSGAAFALAVLAKLTAVILAPVFPVFWAARFLVERPAGSLRKLLLEVGWVALGGLLVAGAAVWLLHPLLAAHRWDAGWTGIAASGNVAEVWGRIGAFGLDRLTRSPNRFVWQAALLLSLGALWASQRAAEGLRSLTRLELLCVSWILAGAIALGFQPYLPERRYLMLLPPLAVLAAIGLASARLRLPDRELLASRGARLAYGASAGVLLGLFCRAPLIDPLLAWTGAWNIGSEPGLTIPTVGLLAWLPFIVVGVGLAPLLARVRRGPRIPTQPVVALVALTSTLPFLVHLAQPSFTIRDTSRRIALLVRDWPQEDRVMVGRSADTLALETDVFSFEVRERPDIGFFLNRDGFAKYRPRLVASVECLPCVPVPTTPLPYLAEVAGYVPILSTTAGSPPGSEPRFRIEVRARPDLAAISRDSTPAASLLAPGGEPRGQEME